MFEDLKIYCAPLQGFTDYVWRNVHSELFGTVDKYYAPFMRVINHEIPNRDIADVLQINNSAVIRPQILATNPTDAQILVEKLIDLGYREIDINMGCPHPPIALKRKGSGILPFPELCEALFHALSEFKEVKYTVKMRLGYDDAEQWHHILPLFDIINPEEIVIHPRIGKQLYKGDLNLLKLGEFIETCHYPIIYNGDIHTESQIKEIAKKYPKLAGVMIGREFIAHPDFLYHDKSVNQLNNFHNLLYENYCKKLSGGEHQILMKMKSLWEVMLPEADKKSKKIIKKCHTLKNYEITIEHLFGKININ